MGSWPLPADIKLTRFLRANPLAYFAVASVTRKEGLSNDSAADVQSSASRPKHEHDGVGVIKLFPPKRASLFVPSKPELNNLVLMFSE